MLMVTKVRKEKGISQSKLSRMADVNASSMSRIVNGLEKPYAKRGQRIADALGWTGTLDELFAEVPDDQIPDWMRP